MDGILNILKPPGPTSHDIVNFTRRLTGMRRCGHTGTLDPAAAGVLPVCVGQATRVSEYVLEMDKVYRAELVLGSATDTQDATGTVVTEKRIPVLAKQLVNQVLREFEGTQSQIPPMYSALKKDGVRLYDLARQGKIVEREPRQVRIYLMELISMSEGKILFDVCCSRGTYVRTLCHDIALKLGTCGHMSFLLRKAVGPFNLELSYTLEELTKLEQDGCLYKALLPLDSALQQFPPVVVGEEQAKRVSNGNTVTLQDAQGVGRVRVYGQQGEIIAVAFAANGGIKPEKVFKQVERR